MSEYQHYAFAAVERPLSADEVATLRALEKRATLNPTRFVAEYHSGDLDARPPPPEDLLLQRFDVHTYVSSWGTAELVLRLPQEALVRDVVKPFLVAERVEVRQKLDTLVLTLHREAGDDPKAHEEGRRLARRPGAAAPGPAGRRPAPAVPGLAAAQTGRVDGDALEPPVPAGLAERTQALEALARLFRLDADLIAAAAEPAPARRPAHALRAAGQARAEARRQQADGAAAAARNKVLDALKTREEQAWPRPRKRSACRAAGR